MKTPIPSLPAAAIEALQSGNMIEAIKITREKLGLGLKEAKDAVDAYQAGARSSQSSGGAVAPQRSGGAEVPVEALPLLESGNLIGAIRVTRERTGLGLKDSKQLVEKYLACHPATDERCRSASASERNNAVLIAIAVAAACVALYSFLRWVKIL